MIAANRRRAHVGEAIAALLTDGPRPLDALAAAVGRPAHRVADALGRLERDGRVVRIAPDTWCLASTDTAGAAS